MKICKVCLSSDLLCGGCLRKLEEGKITKTDVAMSRALQKLSKENDVDVDFSQSYEDDGRIFVVVESRHTARFIGPGGRNIKRLSGLLGKPVKLLEKAEGSEKHVIEKLIGAPILGINKVYSSQKTVSNGAKSVVRGERHAAIESFKIRVERRYMRNVQPLTDMTAKILGKKISFVFE